MIFFILIPLVILAGLMTLVTVAWLRYRFRNDDLSYAWTRLGEALRLKDPRGSLRLQSFKATFAWWEQRRAAYNVLVGGVGSLGSAVLYPFIPKEGASTGSILFVMLVLAALYGVAANTCYTLGWALEGLLQKYSKLPSNRLGALSYSAGLVFSAGITLLIPVLMVIFFVYFGRVA